MKAFTITTVCAVASASIGSMGTSASADDTAAAVDPAEARESPAAPEGVAPLMGVAVALPNDPGMTAEYAWSLKVQVPKVVWEITGTRRPKAEWTEINTDVEMRTLEVAMGYHRATQLAERSQNRLVDLDGKRLDREEALRRLREDTPVLVSVSGDMPDQFYLQFAKRDTLVLIIGLARQQEYSLLPTSRNNNGHADQDSDGRPATSHESE